MSKRRLRLIAVVLFVSGVLGLVCTTATTAAPPVAPVLTQRVYLPLQYLNSGVEPFVLILTTPSWAGTTPCGPLYNNQDFADFFGAAVARYPWVKYWGLYNEVDGSVYSTLHGSSGGCFGEHDLDNDGIP